MLRSYTISLMRPSSFSKEDLNTLKELDVHFPVVHSQWRGYPVRNNPIPFSTNEHFLARLELVEIINELGILFFGVKSSEDAVIPMDAALAIGHKLETWKENLPRHLRYSQNIPIPVYDLQSVQNLGCCDRC